MSLKPKKASQPIALITGGGRRIGATIASYLHEHGFKVLIHCYESFASANDLCDELNAKKADSAKVLVANLDSEQSAKKLINDAIECSGKIDVLINNASIFSAELTSFDKMLLVNVKIPYWLSLQAYPHLMKNKGSIVNITDTHAKVPLKGYGAYCQTKAALLMQTKSLALEFAPNVRVNAVSPGAILWPEGGNSLKDQQKQSIIEKIPLQRSGDPIFIAKAVFSLIDNPYITGHELVVDGGRNIYI